jgi:MFS family permease
MLVSEVPTGYIGDALGRRNSLIAGSCLMLIGVSGYVFAQDFLAFAGIYVVLGLTRTFWSGSGDAWLYDLLESADDADKYTKIRGRGESVTHWASTAAMVGSGGLYLLDPELPFILTGVIVAADIILLNTLPPTGATDNHRVPVRETVPLIHQTLTKPNIWAFVSIAAVFFGIEHTVSEFIPSVTTAVLGTAFSLSTYGNAADVVFLGVFFAGFTATSAIASMYAGPVRARFGAPISLIGAGFISAALLVGSLFSPPLTLLGFATIKTAEAVLLPIVTGYVNNHTQTAGRATVLSAMSMLFSVTKMPLLIGIGAFADATDVFLAVGALGMVFVLVVSGILLLEFPDRPCAEHGSPNNRGREVMEDR